MKSLTLLIKPASGLCNMDCKYCFYKNVGSGNTLMKRETVDVLVERIKEYAPSVLSVVFQGGEPLLAGKEYFAYFVEKLKKSVKGRVYFSLQTNGTLINDEYARFFKENNFLVGVSLDGNKSTNDRYRLDKEGQSTFEKVLYAISLLQKHEVDFNVLSVIDDSNAKDIKKTYAFFKEKGFGFLQFIPYVDEGTGVTLSVEGYEEFLKTSFDLWYEDIKRGNYVSVRNFDNYVSMLMGYLPENCAMSGTCGHYFVVESNGDLFPCDFYCFKENKTGTVFDENPFEETSLTKRFKEESLLIHKNCSSCRYHFICRGGCKKDRIDGFMKNKYCEAYYAFFDYAMERMKEVARIAKGN